MIIKAIRSIQRKNTYKLQVLCAKCQHCDQNRTGKHQPGYGNIDFMKIFMTLLLLFNFNTVFAADKSIQAQPHLAIGCGDEFYALNKIDDVNARLAAQNGKIIYDQKFFTITQVTFNKKNPLLMSIDFAGHIVGHIAKINWLATSMQGFDDQTQTALKADFIPESGTKNIMTGRVQVQLSQDGKVTQQQILTPCTNGLDQ